MAGHVVPAPSDSKIRCSLENSHDGRGTLAGSFYWGVRTVDGDDAAHAAADCWLRVFEERLQGSSGLPELTRITAQQSLSSYRIIVKPSTSLTRRNARSILLKCCRVVRNPMVNCHKKNCGRLLKVWWTVPIPAGRGRWRCRSLWLATSPPVATLVRMAFRSGLHELDLENDGDLVSNENAAGLEGGVPGQAEVLSVDLCVLAEIAIRVLPQGSLVGGVGPSTLQQQSGPRV
jgi:hypothetical protein